MRSLAVLSVALIAAARAPAHAERDPDASWRAEAVLGGFLGTVHAGERGLFGSGFHVDLGARRDRVLVFGEWAFVSARDTTSMPIAGEELPGAHFHRLGGGARVSVGRWGRRPLRGDLWIEGGAGRQWLHLDAGLSGDTARERARTDLAIGLGGQISGRLDRRMRLGVYYAFRAVFTAGDRDGDMRPICAAPCDTATRPTPIDRSILFNVGFIFGT